MSTTYAQTGILLRLIMGFCIMLTSGSMPIDNIPVIGLSALFQFAICALEKVLQRALK